VSIRGDLGLLVLGIVGRSEMRADIADSDVGGCLGRSYYFNFPIFAESAGPRPSPVGQQHCLARELHIRVGGGTSPLGVLL
jgi:hypothetical protein